MIRISPHLKVLKYSLQVLKSPQSRQKPSKVLKVLKSPQKSPQKVLKKSFEYTIRIHDSHIHDSHT